MTQGSDTPSGNSFEDVVPDSIDGERVDRVVSLLTGMSRRDTADLLETGAVQVDGVVPSKPSQRLSTGSVIRVQMPKVVVEDRADSSIPITVVYEDDDVIVIDKQAHLVVHPGSGTPNGTLINALLHLYPEIESVGEPSRPGIVHRLDKGTSGLLMVARSQRAYKPLVEQLSSRTVYRRYVSLASGIVEADEGMIDAKLGRSVRDATRRAVVADGREARTRYEVLERFAADELSLLQLRLETGRTHQIRVHLEAIGHSVVGDPRYGGTNGAYGLTRPFLHASGLGFEHPVSGELLRFESELPADLHAVLDQLASQ